MPVVLIHQGAGLTKESYEGASREFASDAASSND